MADRIGLADELQKLRHAAAHETIAGRIGDCTIGQNGRNLLAWVYENAGSLEAILRANTDPSLSRHHELLNPAGGTIPSDQGNAGGAGPVTGDPPVGSAPQPCADPSLERVEAKTVDLRLDRNAPTDGKLPILDEAVVTGAVSVHAEMLSDRELWIGIDGSDGRHVRLVASIEGRARKPMLRLRGEDDGFPIAEAERALPVPNEGAERC